MGRDPRQKLGRMGEEAAAAYLRRAGYRILARNYACPLGEIDLIGETDDTIVFVEVKTRSAGSLGRPDQAVTGVKRGRLVRAAAAFLSEHDGWERPCRFDVVAVVDRDGSRTATHLPHAFSVEDALGGGRFYQPG
jgi:putative endonuclease